MKWLFVNLIKIIFQIILYQLYKVKIHILHTKSIQLCQYTPTDKSTTNL